MRKPGRPFDYRGKYLLDVSLEFNLTDLNGTHTVSALCSANKVVLRGVGRQALHMGEVWTAAPGQPGVMPRGEGMGKAGICDIKWQIKWALG